MPADYVNKLARMFQDMQVSDDLNTEYRELARNNCESGLGNACFTDNSTYITRLKCRLIGWFPAI